MRIAMASGKGGAGKTMVSSGLAAVWNRPVAAVDADVEAPNLHLFLRPEFSTSRSVRLEVPELVPDLCVQCGACRDICRFKAIAKLGKTIKIFTDMCHGCGGCLAVCPAQALVPASRELGVLEEGRALDGKITFLMGRSRIGEAMTPPQLRELLARLDTLMLSDSANASEASASSTFPIPQDAIVDAPPGVSCPAMTVARGVDVIVLVAEPTPFGFHDFRLARQAFASLGKPLAVVMNRVGLPENAEGDEAMRRFCREHGLPVLAELPFARDAAEAYSRAELVPHISPIWHDRFRALRDRLRELDGGSHA